MAYDKQFFVHQEFGFQARPVTPAVADADINIGREQVNRVIGVDQFDVQVRIHGLKFWQPGQQPAGRQCMGEVHPQGLRITVAGQPGTGIFQLFKNALHGLQVFFTGGGQG